MWPNCCATTICRSRMRKATHIRMDLGPFRHPLGNAHGVCHLDLHPHRQQRGFGEREPATAMEVPCPRTGWPGCRASAWPAPICGCAQRTLATADLVKHVLNEDTLVAPPWPMAMAARSTDFAVHADGFRAWCLLAGSMTPRRLRRLVQRCWKSKPTGWPRCWVCRRRARRRPRWPMPSANWPSWPRRSARQPRRRAAVCWTA